MKNKKVLALIMAIAMAGTVGAPTLKAEAAGLTQAANPNAVVYGSLSKVDIAVLKGMFDYDYYKSENPEVVARIGDSYDKLFEHFYKCGIFEGRTCNPNFDPAAYASAYSDLKDKFGNDIIKYYEHYAAFSNTGERPLTTIAACAKAGITVETLAGEKIKITPQVYKLATAMGTKDYATVAKAAANVSGGSSSSNSSSSSSSGSSSAVVKTDGVTYLLVSGDASAYADATNLTPVNIDLGANSGDSFAELRLFVISGSVGYAAYDDRDLTDSSFFNNKTPVYATNDYKAKTNMSENDIVAVCEINNSPITKNSSISQKDDPMYTFKGEFEYTSLEGTGNAINTYWSEGYGDSIIDTENEATDFSYTHGTEELTGYYTNDSGSQTHTFASVEERDAWLADHNGLNAENDVDYYTAEDVDGTASTTYDVGMDIKENNDGTIDVTVGVYNEENEFGYVSSVTVDPDGSEGQQ